MKSRLSSAVSRAVLVGDDMEASLDAVRSVTFFFPYREVSGVPVLFSRVASHLAHRYGLDTWVIDYANGAMAAALRGDSRVRVVPFRDGEPVAVRPDTVLVMQSILPYTMRPELAVDPRVRVLFWTLHPLNLIPTLVPHPRAVDLQARHPRLNRLVMDTALVRLRDELRQLVQGMAERDAILFMDGTNLHSTTERLGVRMESPSFVPVPVDVPAENRSAGRRPRTDAELRVGWVGRLGDFKVHILLYTLKRLSALAARQRRPMAAYVIGTGPGAAMLAEAHLEHNFFRIHCPGVVTGGELDAYLLEHVDILAAMGTSALEGAKLGIPTILLDPAYGPVRGDYVFRWLFETREYSLGEMLGPQSFQRGNDSLERRVAALSEDYAALSEQSYRYARDHHSLEAVGEELLAAVRRTRFRFADFSPAVLRKSVIRRVYERVRDRHPVP